MGDDIIFMLSKFPGHRNLILDEYMNNEEFKSLCEDFYSTARTLETYQERMMSDVKNELEYRNVFQDLEKEIIRFLDTKG